MDNVTDTTFACLKKRSQKFIEDRDWSKFHSPKNVAIGIAVEASELLEVFQWIKDKGSYKTNYKKEFLQKVQEEVADIFHFLIRLAVIFDFDLVEAFQKKMEINEVKYPPTLCKGSTKIYPERPHETAAQ